MLSFAQPWILAALLVLPLLWLLIRLLPPAPRVIRFAGIHLLAGLESETRRPENAPLWLRILRMVAVAAAILGLAEPLLDRRAALDASRPVVVLMDGGWASQIDWELRRAAAQKVLARAERSGAAAALAVLSAEPPPGNRFAPLAAADIRAGLDGLQPAPWAPDRLRWAPWIRGAVDAGAVIFWITDRIDHGGREELRALLAEAELQVLLPARRPLALAAPERGGSGVRIEVLRPVGGVAETVQVEAHDREGRALGSGRAEFAEPATTAVAELALRGPVANRIASLRIRNHPGAAAVRLVGDSWRHPRVGIVPAMVADDARQPLLQASHYVQSALAPVAETLVDGAVALIGRGVDALVLVDRGEVAPEEQAELLAWVENGGLLVRFAGPRMARWHEIRHAAADPLLPVRIAPGGRSFGGSLSWDRPQAIRPFAADSPFAGLPPPADDARIARQLLAAPDPGLGEKIWARLEDGTPIVTAAAHGEGELVLFHTAAVPGWSSLPLTGTFAGMLERVVRRAGRTAGGTGDATAPWMLETAISARGQLAAAPKGTAPLGPARLREAPAADAPPGLYASGPRRQALAIDAAPAFARPPPTFPASAQQEVLDGRSETPLGPGLLVLALALVLADAVLALRLGRIAVPATVVVLLLPPASAGAQTPPAAQEINFAYVATGDAVLDRTSHTGLQGLGQVLAARTHVEPTAPQAVRPGVDDLSLYPFLYWPLSARQPTPDGAATRALNRYLSGGGLLVVDTRDQGLGHVWNQELGRLLGGLDLPPLALAGPDHVLTRAYFLIQEFPGRWTGGRVWVAQTEGVSPLVVGSSDWAAAWAMAPGGGPVVSLGADAVRRQEMAHRAGVNMVMYALVGDYKGDQVHLPAILERLAR